ncbi:MAG: triose-phosphate isomerase [Pseudomonadota bacterium]
MPADLWIGTSWKMNKTLAEAESFAEALAAADAGSDNRVQRFVIPPFTALREVAKKLAGTSVLVGGQNMHWEDAGPWTGEISPLMLKDCGVHIVELGHSERRAHFGETDHTVGLKTVAATRNGLIPLICVGETLKDKETGRAQMVLERQTRAALAHVSETQAAASVLLAYEPVWAIGDGGIPATPDYADARMSEITAVAEDVLGRRVPCLYGGSVNSENCAEFIVCPHIDGLFIGRSAWNVESYLQILKLCADAI